MFGSCVGECVSHRKYRHMLGIHTGLCQSVCVYASGNVWGSGVEFTEARERDCRTPRGMHTPSHWRQLCRTVCLSHVGGGEVRER